MGVSEIDKHRLYAGHSYTLHTSQRFRSDFTARLCTDDPIFRVRFSVSAVVKWRVFSFGLEIWPPVEGSDSSFTFTPRTENSLWRLAEIQQASDWVSSVKNRRLHIPDPEPPDAAQSQHQTLQVPPGDSIRVGTVKGGPAANPGISISAPRLEPEALLNLPLLHRRARLPTAAGAAVQTAPNITHIINSDVA